MITGRWVPSLQTILALVCVLASVGCQSAPHERIGRPATPTRLESVGTTKPTAPDRKAAAVAITDRDLKESLETSGDGPTRISLSWTLKDNAIGAAGKVNVWRSEDRKEWILVARVPAAAGRYSDAGLRPGTLYFYCLSATGTPAIPFYGNDAFAITIPKNEHSLAALPFEGDVILSWHPVPRADGYEILGSSDGKSFHVVADVRAETTSYRDWSAADGVTDYYKVCAWNLFGNYAPTEIAAATPISRIREKDKTPYDEAFSSVPHGKSHTFDSAALFARNVDPNNDPILRIRSFTQPGHGHVTHDGHGVLTYTADRTYVGPDSFTYTLTDQYNASADPTTVRIAVTNKPPEAVSGRMSLVAAIDARGTRLPHPGIVKGRLRASDPDGDPLTFYASLISGPGKFALDDPATGAYTFVPSQTNHSAAVVEFSVNDGVARGNKASLIFPAWEVGPEGEVKPAGHGGGTRDPDFDTGRFGIRRYSVYQNGTLEVHASQGLVGITTATTLPSISPHELGVNTTPVEPPRLGSVSLTADGSFSYTSTIAGTDWFTCRTTEGDYATALIDVKPTVVTLWFNGWKPGDPNAVLPAAPAYATICMKYPMDLPSGSKITLSVPDRTGRVVKVYDRPPDQSGTKLLFGGDTGKDGFTWTIGDPAAPPSKVYGVGPDTRQEGVLFTLSVLLGQITIGTPATTQPSGTP